MDEQTFLRGVADELDCDEWHARCGFDRMAKPTAATTREPTCRLRLAVLADAITAFRRTAAPVTREEQRTFVEAVRWFASNDATDPLGFVGICHALGLDAPHLRAGLKSIRMRARAARRERLLH